MSKKGKSHFRRILVCLLTIAMLLPMFSISVSAKTAVKNREVWVFLKESSNYITLTATKPLYVNDTAEATAGAKNWNLLYNAAENTLYMRNYNGGPISHVQEAGPFKIVTMGDNYIYNHMPFLQNEGDGKAFNYGAGIYRGTKRKAGTVTEWNNTTDIHGEKGSKLTVEAIPHDVYVRGIYLNGNEPKITGDADIYIKVHDSPENEMEKASGFLNGWGFLDILDNASIKVEMETGEKINESYGFAGLIETVDTTGTINVDMKKCTNNAKAFSNIASENCDRFELKNISGIEAYVSESGSIGNLYFAQNIDRTRFVVRGVDNMAGGIYKHFIVKPGGRAIKVKCSENALLFGGYKELDFLEGEKGVVKASDKEAVSKRFYDFGWLSEYEAADLIENSDGTYTFTVQPGWFDINIISPRYCRQVIATPDIVNAGTVYIDGDEVYKNAGEQERSNWIVETTTVKLRAVPNAGYKFREWETRDSTIKFADKTNPETTYTMYVKEGQGDDHVTARFEEDDIPITFNKMNGSWVSGYTPPASYTFSNKVTLPNASNIKKSGQRFAGWYKNFSCTDGPYTVTDGDIVSGVTYYAKWEDAEGSAYGISLHPSTGGKIVPMKSEAVPGEMVHFSVIPDFGYQTVEGSVYAQYRSAEAPGMTRIELTERTDQKGAYYFEMPTPRSGQDVKIIANFERADYNITYDYNGGTPTIDGKWFFAQDAYKTYNATEDKALTLNISGGILKKPGYTFIGWCETPDCSDVPFTEIKKGTKKGDKTLYAAYEHTLYDIEAKYYDGDDFKASESEYGKIELDVSQAHMGDRVHFTPIPADGCALVRLYVTEKASAPYSATPVEFDDNYNFTMPENAVYVWAEFEPLRNITLPNDTRYEISPFNSSSLGITSLNPCPMGKYFYFKVDLDSEYTQGPEFKVKANGTELTPDGGGVYAVRAGSTDITITVEGVIPKEFEDKITLTANISDSTLTVYADIDSNLKMDEKLAFCAIYDENGKLLKTNSAPIDIEYGKTYESSEFDISGITAKKLKAKYFVWDRMRNLKPLLPIGSKSFTIE